MLNEEDFPEGVLYDWAAIGLQPDCLCFDTKYPGALRS